MGFGLPGENAHAPDEWISVENYTLGMRAAATLLDEYANAVRRSATDGV
jgi:acetylornithine deacetylase/succinyl-diaminopimelate desuccinylase-like protein